MGKYEHTLRQIYIKIHLNFIFTNKTLESWPWELMSAQWLHITKLHTNILIPIVYRNLFSYASTHFLQLIYPVHSYTLWHCALSCLAFNRFFLVVVYGSATLCLFELNWPSFNDK